MRNKILVFIFALSVMLTTISAQIDTTNPNIIIESPLNNFNTTDTGLDINYIANDDTAMGSCWYSDNSGVIAILNACENITSAIWAVGDHNVTIWANDTTGNENKNSVLFKIESSQVQEILFKNFAPQEFDLGDAQFNIQVQNKKSEGVNNLIASISGKG